MAKKSKTPKKHNFKYSQPVTDSIDNKVRIEGNGGTVKDTAVANLDEYKYVLSDLRTLGVLVFALLVLEVGLWIAFNNTGLGKTVYSLVKI